MAKHSTITGSDLHDPKGKYPNFLELDALDTAYLIKDTSGNNYIKIVTATSSETIELSNATTNAEIQILGTGGAEIVGPVTLPKHTSDPSNETTKGKLYTKDPGDGETELFYLDATGNAVQITNNGSVNGGGGGGSSTTKIHVAPSTHTATGTTETLIGSVYLSAGTISTLRALFGEQYAAHTATLSIKRFTGGATLQTLTSSAAPANVSATSIAVSHADWYDFYLSTDNAAGVAFCSGVFLEM